MSFIGNAVSGLFNRPRPQQSVPQDLAAFRAAIIQALMGGGPAGRTQGVLGDLLGLTSGATPGGDVLGPLGDVFNTRLNTQISELNASSPGRFSTANLYQQGQLRQRSLQDFNLLGAQVLEQGRNRQLQAIMGLLGSVLGPTFGGPFTQGQSGLENIADLLSLIPGYSGGARDPQSGAQRAAPPYLGFPYSSPTMG